MSERALWRRVREGLKRRGHLVRVENAVEDGTPDVNYCIDGVEGWIELKHARVPARVSTNVRYQRYTREQADWGVTRRAVGGLAFVLVQVGREVFLFDARLGPALREGRVLGWYGGAALAWWRGSIDFRELERLLRGET